MGKILTKPAIDIFIATTLPSAMRIVEVDNNTSILRDSGMPDHIDILLSTTQNASHRCLSSSNILSVPRGFY